MGGGEKYHLQYLGNLATTNNYQLTPIVSSRIETNVDGPPEHGLQKVGWGTLVLFLGFFLCERTTGTKRGWCKKELITVHDIMVYALRGGGIGKDDA